MNNRLSVVWIVAAWLFVVTAGWAADSLSVGSDPAPAIVEDGGTEVLLDTSFESVFPRLPWRVSHPVDAADVDWGRTQYRATHGLYSIYCAGAGPDAPGDGGPAPANTASWAVVGPYDLSETSGGNLSFELWLSTEQYQDVFMWLVSTDGQSFSGSAISTSTNGWQTTTADLSNWGAAGSVIGEDEVWIAFVYQSDHNQLFEGAYLDEVKLTVDLGTPADEGTTYTTNADFAEGVMVGLESTADQLELADDWDTLPFVWVPNSVTGTVSKLDAVTGDELGRYRTGPTDEVDPGVAAVDLEGSCWVGNRGAGTVVKIGLLENGGCADLDGNGQIDSSDDRDGDGDISGSEILGWGEDECVRVETVLVDGLEGTYLPGDDHENYAANNLQAVAVDANGDVWAGVYDTRYLYHLDGSSGEVINQIDVADEATYPTSAVVDPAGTLWVSSWPDLWVLGYEPGTEDKSRIDIPHGSRGLAVDEGSILYVTGYEHQSFSKIDTVADADQVRWTEVASPLSDGVAVTSSGRIWVAAAGDGTVSRYNPLGVRTNLVSVPGGPTGVAIDQDGKIWVTGIQTGTIYRLDPNSLVSDLQKTLVGTASHNATGDLTGIVARNLTSRFGTWTLDHDSEIPGTPWGRITWQAQSPSGSSVSVRVRSSEDAEDWSAWEPAGSGADLLLTPSGRYLQVQVSMQWVTGDDLPVLEELVVAPASTLTPPAADFTYTPASPVVGQTVHFSDSSTGDPTTWAWVFGDGATSDEQNTSHTFASEAEFDVALTVTNDDGSDTISKSVTVGSGAGCTVSCTATVPATADLGETVSFLAEAEVSGCEGAIEYSWSFGDGATSLDQNPTYTYTSSGTLRWTMTAGADGGSCTRAGDITVSGAGPDMCSSVYWVPVVSHVRGANQSVWRSDLGLLGSDPAGAAVDLRLHQSDAVVSRVVTVAPGAMVNLVDVVDWIEPGWEGSGALEICADGGLVVDSRTYNVLASDHDCFPDGTFGQHLAGDDLGAGLETDETARLGQLRESPAFRTNLGLVNTGSQAATVEIALMDATGAELTSFEVTLEAGRWHQENRPFWRRAGRQDLDAASAAVTVISGGGVVAYASVIDNLTNDATTVPMR